MSQPAQTPGIQPWSGDDDELKVIVESLVGGEQVEVRDAQFTGAQEALGRYVGLPTGVPATEAGVILSTGDVNRATAETASGNLDQPGDA